MYTPTKSSNEFRRGELPLHREVRKDGGRRMDDSCVTVVMNWAAALNE
jgi:hypothetical protein